MARRTPFHRPDPNSKTKGAGVTEDPESSAGIELPPEPSWPRLPYAAREEGEGYLGNIFLNGWPWELRAAHQDRKTECNIPIHTRESGRNDLSTYLGRATVAGDVAASATTNHHPKRPADI